MERFSYPRAVKNSIDRYGSFSHEADLQYPIDWFGLISTIVCDDFKSANDYSVSLKPFQAEIRDTSFAAKFFQGRLPGRNCLCSYLSLKVTQDQN